MAALPPVANVFRLDFQYKVGEDTKAQSSVFYHYPGSPPTVAQLQACANAAQTAWSGNFSPLAATTIQLEACVATDLSSPVANQGIWTTSLTGSRVGGELTAETAVVISFKLARRFRGGHPRIYVPLGVSSDLADPQTWQSTFTDSVRNGWNAINAAVLAAAGGPPADHQVAVSYFQGGTWVTNPSGRPIWRPAHRPGGPIYDNVVGVNARTKPGSQRHRML